MQTTSPKPILRACNDGVTSDKVRMGLKCLACELAKAKRKQPDTDKSYHQQEMAIRANDLRPGDAVSVDQYHSSLPGRLPDTRGREAISERYNGGTIVVDHASGYIHLRHQISLNIDETLKTVEEFEHEADSNGFKTKHYRTDNAPFCCKHLLSTSPVIIRQ